jgi:hypothetical protein
MLKILKKWKGNSVELAAEGEPIDWFETTQEECLLHTEGAGYWIPGTVLPMLARGETVFTPFALYIKGEGGDHNAENKQSS